MTVRKKIEQAIDKGAKVKADSAAKGWTNFTLRIRQDMLQDIDQALEETVGISKTGWILQAIQDKLRKSNE